jgi:hypothetical protein
VSNCTPLTEPQARALAQWWGGAYAPAPESGKALRHGVTLPSFSGTPADPDAAPRWVGTMEEARHLETQRQGINPAAPDWDG